MKDLDINIIIIAIVSVIALGLGFAFFEWLDLSFINYGWDYLNNQSVAVVLTFILALFGYYLGFEYWEKQHKKGLYDSYLREFIDLVVRWYTIKKDQTNYRKEQTKSHYKKECIDPSKEQERQNRYDETQYNLRIKLELDRERNKVHGRIDTVILLFETFSDHETNREAINSLYKEFFENFGSFEKTKIGKNGKEIKDLFKCCKEKIINDKQEKKKFFNMIDSKYNEINQEWDKSYERIKSLIKKIKL